MKTKLRILLTFILFTLISASVTAANWYVKPNASGTGASWDDACNISVIAGTPAGIADGDVVYVAAGTYESSTSKTVDKYITIMGGYASNLTGTQTPTRNLTADSTIFVPTSGGTARCLVLNATLAPTVNGQKIVLDGLNFKGFTMPSVNGGTALSIASALSGVEIKNCDFLSNISTNANGGAVNMSSFAQNITISFDNCKFKGNKANYDASTWVTNNPYGYGGAVYFNNGSTAKTINFTNCYFKNNSAYGRAGALYFTSVITCNITDCVFDTNFSSNTTDNFANGNGGCIYVAGGTAANTFNLLRTAIVNSSNTSNGSVFWFNTTPKNTLNLTDCSLIGNYSSRTSSNRAAVDCSNFATTLGGTISGCVMSNYNWSGGVKASNKADVMYLTGTSTDVNLIFSNSILNGVYLASSNASAAVSPTVLYTTTGFLKDSTIALALSGDLKITDKVVFRKTFTAANLGSYVHTQIFDVKRLTAKAMILNATIPTGYKLTVDGIDYSAGDKTINIAASASEPVITLAVDGTTAINSNNASKYKLAATNGILSINGLTAGDMVKVYNANGQLIANSLSNNTNMQLDAKGLVIVKINSFVSKILVK